MIFGPVFGTKPRQPITGEKGVADSTLSAWERGKSARLLARTHNNFAPPMYLMAAALSARVVLTMREAAKHPRAG